MTSAEDRNDLMPAQEKLEWVTPKISLMEAGDTDGKVLKGSRNLLSIFQGVPPDRLYLKPLHTYKNQ